MNDLPLASLRLDRVDSRALLRAARAVLNAYPGEGWAQDDPVGVVLSPDQRSGRVVFDRPVLLPEEQFVPLDLIRGRSRPARRRCPPTRVRLSRSQPPPP